MPSASRDHHKRAVQLSKFQSDVISRKQLISIGWTDKMIRSQVAAHRWRSLARGVFLTNTGEPTVPSWWWASHLLGGERSYLFGDSALQAWGLRRPSLPVSLGVPWNHHFRSESPELVITRHRFPAPVRSPSGLPPAAKVEFAVVDATEGMRSTTKVAALVTEACQRGKTTPGRIARAMTSYKRLRHRALLLELVREVEDGSQSVLEVDAAKLVLRAHGLPPGNGQVRESNNGSVVFRDRVIEEFGVVLEFDGRLGHSDPHSRFRDFRRDNAVVASGRTSLRFGWEDVHENPCEAALQIAQVLKSRGWAGDLEACGPFCSVTVQDRGRYVPL